MKTIFVSAVNVGGGDKIIVDGVVAEVYDADYNSDGPYSDVSIELSNGEKIVVGCFSDVEVVVEE